MLTVLGGFKDVQSGGWIRRSVGFVQIGVTISASVGTKVPTHF
jgi:hypothetical protein